MAIYTDKLLLKRINTRGIVIHPLSESSITGLGYDLSIGVLKPLSKISEFKETVDFYHIPPLAHCLVITKEFVWLSKNVVGTLHARGTLAAKGIFTNSTNVDPNFKGQMIMSIINLSNVTVKLSKSDTFITLIFHSTLAATKTLVGEEGTKNSMRVIELMRNEVYPNDSPERKSIEDLNAYLTASNTLHLSKFDRLVASASGLGAIYSRLKYGSKIIGTIKPSLGNLLKLGMIGALIYFIYGLFPTIQKFNESSVEDKRALVLVVTAIVTLVLNMKFKRNNEK